MNYGKGKTSTHSVVSSCHFCARYGYNIRLETGDTHSSCYGKIYVYNFLGMVERK